MTASNPTVAQRMIQTHSAAEPAAISNRQLAGVETMPVTLRVNGVERALRLDPRVTLLHRQRAL